MNFLSLRLRNGSLLLIGTAIAGAVFLQCVGDDPAVTAPSTNDSDAAADSSTNDSGTDGGPTTCAWDKPFNTPVAVPGIPTGGAVEGHPSLSPDELTIYFHGNGGSLSDGSTMEDLYMSTRGSVTDAFGVPVRLTISTNFVDGNPSVSHDGTTLYYDQTFDGGGIATILWVARRTAAPQQFSGQVLVPSPPAGMSNDDGQPFLTADDVELWFTSRRDGGTGALDVYSAKSSGGSFGPATLESMVSSNANDYSPSLSFDRLTVYISSGRAGGVGGNDIWRSHRSTVNDAFPEPVPVTELNTSASEFGGWLSSDNCRYYFETTRGGQSNLYLATRTP